MTKEEKSRLFKLVEVSLGQDASIELSVDLAIKCAALFNDEVFRHNIESCSKIKKLSDEQIESLLRHAFEYHNYEGSKVRKIDVILKTCEMIIEHEGLSYTGLYETLDKTKAFEYLKSFVRDNSKIEKLGEVVRDNSDMPTQYTNEELGEIYESGNDIDNQ